MTSAILLPVITTLGFDPMYGWTVEKSALNFKKLSRISNMKGKQKIWEFCKEFLK